MKKKFLSLTLAAGLLATAVIGGTLAYFTDTDTVTNTFTLGKINIALDEAQVNSEGLPVKGNVESGYEVIKNGNADYAEYGREFQTTPFVRVQSNKYHLVPAHQYFKDPTVTVDGDSEPCYIWTTITVKFNNKLTADGWENIKLEGNKDDDGQPDTTKDIILGFNRNDWKNVGGPTISNNDNTVTYRYIYAGEGVTNDIFNPKADNADKYTNRDGIQLTPLFQQVQMPANWTNNDVKKYGGFTVTVNAYAIQAYGFDSADEAWSTANPTGGTAIWEKNDDGITTLPASTDDDTTTSGEGSNDPATTAE